MDEFDRAQEVAERNLAQALDVQRHRRAQTAPLAPTGECLNPRCGESIGPLRLFCNPLCEGEYARLQR